MAIKLAFIFISFLIYSTNANEEIEETPSIARFALGHIFGCSADELNSCLENQAVETVRSLKEDYKTSIDRYMIKARRISKRMKTDSSVPEAQEVTKLQHENEQLIEKIRGKEDKPNGLLDEISDFFTYGVAKVLGYFTNDKQSEDDLTEKIILQAADGRSVEEARGHKKKYLKKQNKHLKLILLVMLFKNKVKMFVHKLQFLVQLKFLGIAVVNLLINLVRLWLELKKKHKPHKVVYYENAHHQHHYDHEHLHEHEDGHYSHPGSHSHHAHHEEEYSGGSWPWSRSYIEKQSEQAFQTINANKPPTYPAHNLVYLKQRPVR